MSDPSGHWKDPKDQNPQRTIPPFPPDAFLGMSCPAFAGQPVLPEPPGGLGPMCSEHPLVPGHSIGFKTLPDGNKVLQKW